jgi:hypothetical protein
MTRGRRSTLARVGDYLRLRDCLDLSGSLITDFVPGIIQNRACFGSGGCGVSVQQDRLGGCLSEGGTDRENEDEQSYEQNVGSHGGLHAACQAKASPERWGSQLV